MLRLGSELAKALKDPKDHDLLANWMAHHLAEKIALEKAARGEQRKQLSNDCADLILKLWAHRHSMPDGTRPLESFEPMFCALQELISGGPRNSYLRAVPTKIKAPKKIEELLSLALTIDVAAKTLIRYTLAEAVAKIPEKDKRWTKLRAAIAPSQWDIRVILRVMDDVEALVDEKQKLQGKAIKDLQEMVAGLQAFQELARQLEAQFFNRLAIASGTAAE